MYVFQGFACLPWCSCYRYYIINEFKNWTEAQNYCRKYYYDLATFDNKEEHDQVVQTLRSGGFTGSVWIGLYDDRYSWRWSNSKKNMTYTNWAGNEPNNYQSKEACAIFTKRGDWADVPCENPFFFLCYNATMNTTVLIQEKKSWSDALNYCRLYHTDSATIENQDENTALKLLLNDQNVDAAYMGLYRDRWKWSDQSSSVFRAWKSSEPNNFNGTEFCAQLPVLTAQWNDISCSVKLRYVCGTGKKTSLFADVCMILALYGTNCELTV
ncbi:hypothetical protein cypCar_00034366 [Cyprinus carpio]|nr:hypothetical protein cypCar_00034366 [Cyprinus carpio]